MNLYYISEEFVFYSWIIQTIIGFIGNTINIFIFSSKSFRSIPINRYLVFLSIADILMLSMKWSDTVTSISKKNILICKYARFVTLVLFQFCAWISVLISIDRIVAVINPFRYTKLSTLRHQIIAITGLVILLSALNTPLIFYSKITVNGNKSLCTSISGHQEIGNWVYTIFSLLFISIVIPIIIMAISTAMIAFKLVRLKSKLNKSYEREVRYAKTLVAMMVFFIFCNLPICISFFLNPLLLSDKADIIYLVGAICGVITSFYNSFSFLIYFTSNDLFRETFIALIKRQKIQLRTSS
jgi:hypothetical protein